MDDKHKRLTKSQVEIWLDNPATKTYLQCLEWSSEQISEVLGKGGCVNSSNNDITANQIHTALGEKSGLARACNPIAVLELHEMLEPLEEKRIIT